MPSKKTPKKLSAKEQLFVLEYLKTLNAAQAAMNAGYAASTAEDRAYIWIGKTRSKCPPNKRHVWDAVKKGMADRVERTKVDADWVLKRLVAEAEADLDDLYDGEGNLLPIADWPLIWRQGLVAGIDTTRHGEEMTRIDKVKISDRIKRIELIGKHVNIQAFQENVKLGADDDLVRRLNEGLKRDRSSQD
jgi:phage terminase small subunit